MSIVLAHYSLLNTVCKESHCIFSSQCLISQVSFSAKRSCSISKHLTFKLLSAEHSTDLSNQLILLLLIQILTICAFNWLIESAQSTVSSTSAIWQHQLAFSCSVFLTQFSLTQIFLLISLLSLCLIDLILTFEILIESTVTNSYSASCCAFVKRSSVCSVSHHVLFSCLRFQLSLLLQAVIQSYAAFLKRSFVCISEYLISCSISGKDLVFTLKFQYKSTNFSSICILQMIVNLANLINRNLIRSSIKFEQRHCLTCLSAHCL